jgi:small-conductance mechanosensitive channel
VINLHTLRTWPFIILVLSNLAAWLATLGSTVSVRNAWMYGALSAGAYALARGFAKFQSDTTNFWQNTEFYVVILGAVSAILGASTGHISDNLMKELLAGLTAVSMIARGLALSPATQVQPPDRVYNNPDPAP